MDSPKTYSSIPVDSERSTKARSPETGWRSR
ncbi:unnamed protein product [Linum tenue]|uniref:Uncharacterized protein n=1 Tax=Linum tenue TaxID=586396 RepID=A0AAV0MFW6_9ROSI|nr:unnamed protein product [Linum tenue]